MNELTILLACVLAADLPREAVDAEIAIAAQVTRIESVIPLPDDFERKNPIPEPKRPVSPSPTKPDPKPSACDCGGTGFVTDSANWKRVRCACGKKCKCGSKGIAPPSSGEAAEAAALTAGVPRANRGVIVSAEWCGPCNTIKNVELPKLKRSDWLVNEGPPSHLLVIDYDEDLVLMSELLELPGAPERITSLPTFFRIEGNKITATHEGVMAADQIARFIYPSLEKEAGGTAKAAPGGGNASDNTTGQVCPRCGKVHATPQVMQSQPIRSNGQSNQFLWWSW